MAHMSGGVMAEGVQESTVFGLGSMTAACRLDPTLQAQLELARQVQLSLLPRSRCCLSDWEIALSYEPAGFVSGDYVDLIPAGEDAFYFALGDVSGKGVAASMLMSHLHATLRTLLPSTGAIEDVVRLASRTFCESALPAHFATLVLGKADRSGAVELVNAGHTPVLLLDGDDVEMIAAASLPLGLFCSTDFSSVKRSVSAESVLFLSSDGITEATDGGEKEFALTGLADVLYQSRKLRPSKIVETVEGAVARYTGGRPLTDDRTMLALRWSPKGL